MNAALNGCGEAASGPELVAITVADFTGIQPDHFALFDFEDFTRVIDAFGGTGICVENPVRERKLNIPAGCTEVDGELALIWIRSRHTEEFVDGRWRTMRGVNDLTRNERQRDLLIQMLGKVKSLDALTSLISIVDSVSDAVTIDEGITVSGAIGVAWDLRSAAPREIIKVTIPVRNHRTEGGASVLLPATSFEEVFAEYWPYPPASCWPLEDRDRCRLRRHRGERHAWRPITGRHRLPSAQRRIKDRVIELATLAAKRGGRRPCIDRMPPRQIADFARPDR